MVDGTDDFDDVLRHLRQGDFSTLAPHFACDTARDGRSRIVRWFMEGRFQRFPDEALEALTCACFLGENATAEYLLRSGLPAAGGAATGMNTLHNAASRGHAETVRLLLRHGVPLEERNRYGGTALAQTVWSAMNEPMAGQREALLELLRAGADPTQVRVPTGSADIDALLESR